LANIYDVAKRANTSVATVSAVVNNSSYVSPALKEKVEHAIAELKYSPNHLARSLARQKSHTIGIIIPDIANAFFSEVVRGAEDKVKEAGYTLILGNSDNQVEKEELYLNVFLSKRVDGILLVKAAGEISAGLRETLLSSSPPIVLVDREYSGLKADTVVTDNAGGSYAATQHLIKLGHRRIGVICGTPGLSTTEGRLQGYRDALAARAIPFDPALVAHGDYGVDSGYTAGTNLIKQHPTAIFVTNCMMTIGLMQFLDKQKLRCPEDVAIVSYDDVMWNEIVKPKLTCIVQPKYLLGYRSAEILISRIRGNHKRLKFDVLDNELRIRESSGESVTGASKHR
jgi:DNA-binding LacI/PurR family transcriptional regulator